MMGTVVLIYFIYSTIPKILRCYETNIFHENFRGKYAYIRVKWGSGSFRVKWGNCARIFLKTRKLAVFLECRPSQLLGRMHAFMQWTSPIQIG